MQLMQAPVRQPPQLPTPWRLDYPPSQLATPNWRRGWASATNAAEERAAAAFRRAYGPRIRTGSVYHPYTRSMCRVLVVRSLNFSAHPCHYQEWAPGLAPHADLEAAYTAGRLSWQEFARQYLRRLQAFPWLLAEARARIASLLTRYPAVMLLGLERASDEVSVHCHRRLLQAWLLGETGLC
jgi:uncharacterized protein YeaO (DUF488 family)